MRDFDATIKLLIQDSSGELLRQIGMEPVKQWLNVELPRVRNRRADLLGLTASGEVIHIEIQSENDPEMSLRMAEYALAILRKYKRFPHQLLLFVGNGQLTMKARLSFAWDGFPLRPARHP